VERAIRPNRVDLEVFIRVLLLGDPRGATPRRIARTVRLSESYEKAVEDKKYVESFNGGYRSIKNSE